MNNREPNTAKKRMDELYAIVPKYAKAKAEKDYLDHFRKSKLAMLMKDYEVAGVKTTAAQERDARAHPEYIEVLEGLRAATEISERLYWELRVAQAGIQVYQTEQANRREELKLGSGVT